MAIVKDKIWLSSPHMSEQGFEMEYIREAFDGNWIAPLGPNVTSFETEICNMIDSKHAAVMSSGTAAIHLALKAVGVGEDDIVLCSTLTFSATANPIIYLNAQPVFIDSDNETWNMDPSALEEALIKYEGKVRAVVVVHIYGFSADMDKILSLCKKFNVPVIEDAAESLGTLYKNRYTGTLGDFGVFSFNGNKIITTSGGGALVSRDKEKIDKVKFWSTQSRDNARHYQHSELGYNYRMSNISAGIGRGQLKVLQERVEKKKYIFNYYKKNLSDIDEITFMPVNEWNSPNYWLSVFTINGSTKPLDIIEALEKENIESRPVWKPMHLQPFFEKYDYIGSNISEQLFKHGICLPSDTKLTDSDLEKICSIIKSVIYR